MMNLLSVQNHLKDLSDRQLAEQMNTGASPQFLVLSEMQRRQKMRQSAGAANEAPKSTVAEEISQAATPGMEQGIAALPMEPPAFADGGIVSFAQGGDPKDSKRYTQSSKKPKPKPEAKKAPEVVRNARGETLEQVMKRLGIDSAYAEFPLEDSHGRINWYMGSREDLLSGSPGSFTMSMGTNPAHRDELMPFVTAPRKEDKPTVGPASTKVAEPQPPAGSKSAVVPLTPSVNPAAPSVVPADDQAVTNVLARPALARDTETSVTPARASAPAGEAPSAGLQSLLDVVAGGSRGVAGGAMPSGGADLSSAPVRASAPAGSTRGAGVGSLLAAPAGARGVAGGAMPSGGADLSSAPVRASATKASGAGVRSLLAAPAARGVAGGDMSSGGAQMANDAVYASSAIEEPSDFTLYESPRPTTLYEIPGVLPPGTYTEAQIKEILGESYDAKTQRPLAFADRGQVPVLHRVADTFLGIPGRTRYEIQPAGGGPRIPIEYANAKTQFPHAFDPKGEFRVAGSAPAAPGNPVAPVAASNMSLEVFGKGSWDQNTDGTWQQRGTGLKLPDAEFAGLNTRFKSTRPQNLAETYAAADTGTPPWVQKGVAGLVGHLARGVPASIAKAAGESIAPPQPLPTEVDNEARRAMGDTQTGSTTPGAAAIQATPINRVVVGKPKPKALTPTIVPTPALTNVLPSAFPMDLKSTMGALAALEPTKYNTDKETALLKKLQDRVDARKDEPFNMGLMQAGLSMMAGTSPHAMTNMGAGGIKGLEAYAAGKKDLRDLEKEITAAELAMEKAAKDNDWKTYEANASRLASLAGLHQEGLKITETARHNKEYERIQTQQGHTQAAAISRAEKAERIKYYVQHADNLTAALKNEMDPKARAALQAQLDTVMSAWAAVSGNTVVPPAAPGGKGRLEGDIYVPHGK